MINNDAIKELSFMILKGTYGLANNYEVADINDNNEINVLEAYHPLIETHVHKWYNLCIMKRIAAITKRYFKISFAVY